MDYPQVAPGYRQGPDLPARRGYYEANSPANVEKPDAVTLDQLLQPLRRNWKLVAATSLAGVVFALLAAIPQKPVYQARALLEIQAFNDNFLNMGSVAPTMAERGIEPSYIQTEIKLLQSDVLLERVARKLHIDARNTGVDQPGRLTQLLRTMRLERAPLPGQTQFLKQVASGLSVRPVGETHIVEVQYEAEDPNLAANFANTLVGEFITLSLERRVNNTQQTGVWLTAQIHDLRANLERSEQQLESYARQVGLLYTNADKDSVAESKLRQLQESLSKAQEDRVTSESRYNRARVSPAEALPEVLEDATLRGYETRLTELKRQLAELSATYTPAYYKVKETKAQITELQKAIEGGSVNILKRIRNQYEAAVNREKMLEALYGRQSTTVSTLSEKSVRYNMLKREVDTNRQLYDTVLQKVKEAGIASGIRASALQIVDPATAPQLPARPNVPLYGGVGLLAGMFAGMGFVFVRRRGDMTIQAPGDAGFHLRFPELGAIPDAVQIQPWGFPRLLRARGAAPAESGQLELISWREKHSPLAESFRAALASVLFSGPKGEWPRAVVITSSEPGEGKTVVASNFAIALAETSHRVLLVDGDLRRPRLHDVFGLPNDEGFSELLRGATPCKNYPAEALGRKTEIPGLYVLTSGPESAGAANLLYSPRAAELLQRLRREFQAIIIDTAPLSVADARGLARLADGVAFVVRADRTAPEVASAALRRLSDDGAVVLGTILNSWDMRKTSDRQYMQYS